MLIFVHFKNLNLLTETNFKKPIWLWQSVWHAILISMGLQNE